MNEIPGWSNPVDERITYLDDELIDEAVMSGANVHLEALSDSGAYLIIDNGKLMWHFSISAKKGKLRITLMESEVRS